MIVNFRLLNRWSFNSSKPIIWQRFFVILLLGIVVSCTDPALNPDEQTRTRLKRIIRSYSIDDYIYNAQNKLQAIIHRSPTDSTQITYRQDYNYDQVGKLKSEVYTNGPAATQNNNRRIDFEYNSNGQVVREVYFTGGSRPEQYQVDSIFYDVQKRVVKRKLVGRSDIESSTLDYVYNARNNIETVYHIFVVYLNRGTSFRSKTNYTYDTTINPFYSLVGASSIEYNTPNNRTKEIAYLTYQMSGDLEILLKSVTPTNEFNYSYEYKDSFPTSSVIGTTNVTKYVYEIW